MAETKKKTEAVVDAPEEITEENIWKKKRTVILVKRFKQDKRRDVCVDGRWFNVKTNTPVEVPEPVARLIDEVNAQEEAYQEMVDNLERKQQELKY